MVPGDRAGLDTLRKGSQFESSAPIIVQTDYDGSGILMASAALMRQGDRKRKQIVRFVERYIAKHGHSPSIEDIAAGVGLASKGTVRYHVSRLLVDGELVHDPRVHRSLRLPAA